MRWYIKDSERLPDPPPVPTDDRKVILVGIVLWLIALATLLVFLSAVVEAGRVRWLWTTLVGIGLGLGLLVFAQRKQG